MGTAHFGPQLVKFLAELDRNNNREWFQKNKSRYERDVRDPLLRFITDFGPRLGKINPHFVADPRPVGGSLFRIYRDTRFSRDKRPYKPFAAVQFRHEQGKDVHAPGFYLHIEPKSVFVGVGLWHPDGGTLAKIRTALVEDPAGWKRSKNAKTFRERFAMAGDSLKRAPKGFDPDHPLIEDLRRKDFIAVAEMSPKEIVQPDFLSQFAATARAAKPFMGFLTRGCGLAW